MAKINPQQIRGAWAEGYALDHHVVRSIFLGYDDLGHPRFETTRSEVGELLYRLKYQNDQSTVTELAETAAAFVKEWKPDIDALMPVTPSRVRAIQPVVILGAAIAQRIGVTFSPECT